MSDTSKKFVLIMRDRRNVTRARRAKLYADGSIVWKKKLYYYSNDPRALTYYPTKPHLYGFTLGLLPAHNVREENSLPILIDHKHKDRHVIDKQAWINGSNGMPDVIPENPYQYEGSDIAHKFKESNVVGGLAIAARKAQSGQDFQKHMMYGIFAIAGLLLVILAMFVNSTGLLKLW